MAPRRPIALLPMIYTIWAAWQKHRVTEWRGLCARQGETPGPCTKPSRSQLKPSELRRRPRPCSSLP
eukprot:2744443-Amphidinium_carterae.2